MKVTTGIVPGRYGGVTHQGQTMRDFRSITRLLRLTLVLASASFFAPAMTRAADPYYPLVVRGGKGLTAKYEQGILRVQFHKAPVAATDDPRQQQKRLPVGSAAWVDRPLNANEPARLEQATNREHANAAIQALRNHDKFWIFECRNTGSGYFEVRDSHPAPVPID